MLWRSLPYMGLSQSQLHIYPLPVCLPPPPSCPSRSSQHGGELLSCTASSPGSLLHVVLYVSMLASQWSLASVPSSVHLSALHLCVSITSL